MRLLTLKSILLATDLEESSRFALRAAGRLASLSGARLHLLHVASASTPEAEARLRERFRHELPETEEPASARVITGSPAQVIIEQADQVNADAVILGAHRRATAGGELGSTAASVVRTSLCPCLVAATELRLPLERVTVPIDFSGIAGGALSVALSWATALRPRGADVKLTVMHVVGDPVSSAAAQKVNAEVLRARTGASGAAYVEIRESVIPGGEPAKEILREAAASSADLLVMGMRRAAGAAGDLGSVSAAVARATPCPLLLIPPAVWEEGGAA